MDIGFGFRLLGCVAILLGAYSWANGQDQPTVHSEAYEAARLERIESQQLPEPLVLGAPQHSSLPDYYLSANQELAARLVECRSCYESNSQEPFHRLTLISGVAGAGKTFFKGLVFSRDYPAESVCKFDLRELFEAWEEKGLVERRSDLAAGKRVLNTLPALAAPHSDQLLNYLRSQPGNFFVIDSLDEIHPDDFTWVLEQVEQFTFESDRPFLHVVVLGRGSAFREFWKTHRNDYSATEMALFNLQGPLLRTTGDQTLSTWNYHVYQHGLAWKGESAPPFTLDDFTAWERIEFQPIDRFAAVHVDPVDAIDPEVELTFAQWTQSRPYLDEMLRNLAGNSMIREIAFSRLRSGAPCDEDSLKREYFHACLNRNSGSQGRPSRLNPEHLELYLTLLKAVANKMADSSRLNEEGFFQVDPSETVTVDDNGQLLTFPIQQILDRSGVVFADAQQVQAATYRFEPLWVHRMLIEMDSDPNLAVMLSAQDR